MLRLQHPHPCGGGGGAELCTDRRYRIDPLPSIKEGNAAEAPPAPPWYYKWPPRFGFEREPNLLSKSELFGVAKWVAVNSYVADFLSLRCETHPEF